MEGEREGLLSIVPARVAGNVGAGMAGHANKAQFFLCVCVCVRACVCVCVCVCVTSIHSFVLG